MDGELTPRKIVQNNLRRVNREWLFAQSYSFGLLQQTDLDKSDLAPLCDAIEKDKRNVDILVKILRSEPAYGYIADIIQDEFSK